MASLFNAQTEIDVIRALERGNYINQQTIDRKTPLYIACANGNLEVVNALLNNGADPLIHTQFYGGPIQIASKNGYVNIVERLLKAGVDINNDQLGTPLSYASKEGNIDVIDFLLSQGADVNYVSYSGSTALVKACEYGRIDAVDRLLQAGADVNIISRQGYSPLGAACYHGYLGIVDRLLIHGAIIDIYDNISPPLISAVEGGEFGIVDRLIQMGANVDIESYWGLTPLSVAVNQTQLKIIELLMDNGANPDTVGDAAELKSHKLISEWLESYDATKIEDMNDIMDKLIYLGVNVNAIDEYGYTPLIIAVRESNVRNVILLLQLGVDVNLENINKYSALWHARNVGNREIIDLLEQCGAQ